MPDLIAQLGAEVMNRCDRLASVSEEEGCLTRRSYTPAMSACYDQVETWMTEAGMTVRRDAAGNLVGERPGADPDAPFYLLGSHLDTVCNAGKYDGILGVLLPVALVKALAGEDLSFGIRVVAFMDEEGVRFGRSYFGSMALAGCFDSTLLQLTDHDGVSVEAAMRAFGAAPEKVESCAFPGDQVAGFIEVHIEQGPVLEALDLPVGVVEAVASQGRLQCAVRGKAGHAGTTPMALRKDALAGAAEMLVSLEERARSVPGLVITVGEMSVQPGAGNVIPGEVAFSVDLRHPDDQVRRSAGEKALEDAAAIAGQRGMEFKYAVVADDPATRFDAELTARLGRAAAEAGYPGKPLFSGAGHDAVMMARSFPTSMLFVRCKDGLSHHPDESVRREDVEAALKVLVVLMQGLQPG